MSNKSHQKNISYNDIILLSKSNISKRANTYKNMVITVSLLIVGSIIISFYQWSTTPLIALFFFFPIYSIFLFLDYRQVQNWKEKILQAWANKALEIEIVKEIIKAVPHLPDATINSMLDTLPNDKSVDLLNKKKRTEIFKKQQLLHRLQRVFYLGGIIRTIIFFILIYMTIYFSNSWLLFGFAAIYSYKIIEIKLLKAQWYKIINKNSDKSIQVILNNFDQHPFTSL